MGSPESSAKDSTKSNKVSTSWKAACLGGLKQDFQGSIPRIAAISGVTFRANAHTPETCLGTLAELDFNGFDLREGLDLFLKHLWIKSTLWITTPKITRANLPDQVASMRMMGRDASFPRVMKRSSRGTAPVDCLHRSPAQATKAHGGYIDDGGNPENLRALAGLPEDLGTRNRIIRFAKGTKKREGTVFDEQVVGRQIQVVVNAQNQNNHFAPWKSHKPNVSDHG